MRVLVTGGLGYLGGRLAQALMREPGTHKLTLATRRIGRRSGAWRSDAIIVTIDWGDDRSLQQACEGIDAIVHLAGMNAAESAANPAAALEFNGLGTARLIRAAILEKVKRFIYVSTAHVYGTSLKGSVDESTCPEPRHPYATSHRAGEDAVRWPHQTGAIDGIIARLSNAFGAPVDPGTDCWSLVTNDLSRQAVHTRRAVLRTVGTQRRDFIPVSEVCRAIIHLLKVPSSQLENGIFNVGSGWAPTMLELAQLVAERVAVALGFLPEVIRGSAGADVGEQQFEYRVHKLLKTAFEPRPAAIVDELDGLVQFCVQHTAPGPT